MSVRPYKSLMILLSTNFKIIVYFDNCSAFKNNVEIHINHIQSGLSQMGNLHAFAATSKLNL